MGYPNKILPYYTYDDYCQWKGQWELIDGIPYAMSPMPRPEHQKTSVKLSAALLQALEKSNCKCTVYQPIDYRVADDTVLNPDLLVVCKPITKQYLDFAPDIVVEILSPATALKDRHTKFEIYQQEKIPYYLMVDVDEKKVEVYQLVNDQYKLAEMPADNNFVFQLNGCSVTVPFEAIWD